MQELINHSDTSQNTMCWTQPPNDLSPSRMLSGALPFSKKISLIDKQTPIGAAGSCFADEITHYLKANQYNYIVTEPNEHSCAAWGALYNTPSFAQLVDVAFGLKKRTKILFEYQNGEEKEYWDPYREAEYFKSIEDYENSIEPHLAAAREALLKAKVFIMTVGLNEIWRLNYDNSVLARYPRTIGSHFVHRQILTVQDNINELQHMLDVWKAHNPDLKIIITVSPVPLHAAFRADDCHVIPATCHSKSVLRIAVNQFAKQNPGVVHYFPAFEVVSYCSPKPFMDDCRHVTRETVGKVMELFESIFLI
jgi:hypothetical protein